MLEKCVRKINDILRVFLAVQETGRGNKYIDRYDAASLSFIDIDDASNTLSYGDSEHKVKIVGLKRLISDIEGIYTEALVEQQDFTGALVKDLGASEHIYATEFSNSGSSSSSSSSSSRGKISNDDASTKRLNMLRKQLKPVLLAAYSKSRTLIDTKLVILKVTQEIITYYTKLATLFAHQNGVRCAADKVAYATGAKLEALVKHRFFGTQEEQQVISKVRTMWSGLFLGLDIHADYADRELSFRDFMKKHRNEHVLLHTKVGAILILLIWAFSECFNNETADKRVWADPTFAIFMCLGDFILLLFMWGVSIAVWRRNGIDFVQLLSLEDTVVDTVDAPEYVVFGSAANLSLVFLAVFVVFNKIRRMTIVEGGESLAMAHAIPIGLMVMFGYWAVHPLKNRQQWWAVLGRVLAAPCFPVNFRDGYIGDLLTSLVRVFVPLAFSVTYLLVSVYAWLTNDLSMASSLQSGWWKDSWELRLVIIPILTLLPLVLRLLQCLRRAVESGKRWPHFFNAAKYSCAIAVISFGTFQPELRENLVWVTCFVLATLYQFVWDITQDWGMITVGVSRSAPHAQLGLRSSSSAMPVFFDRLQCLTFKMRKQRLLGPEWTYWIVVIGNLTLRFAWTLSLLPNAPLSSSSTVYESLLFHLHPMLAAAEILRRMVWGFFRLEWEQLERVTKSESSSNNSNSSSIRSSSRSGGGGGSSSSSTTSSSSGSSNNSGGVETSDSSGFEMVDVCVGGIRSNAGEAGAETDTEDERTRLLSGAADHGHGYGQAAPFSPMQEEEMSWSEAVEQDFLSPTLELLPFGDRIIPYLFSKGRWLPANAIAGPQSRLRLAEGAVICAVVMSIIARSAFPHF